MDLLHPPAEVHIDADLVRALLASQYPALADAPLTLVDEGWDNVTYRAGTTHAVRVPRREVAVELLLNEQRWLPVIGPRLPVAVPQLVFAGTSSGAFPWPWSVVQWVDGVTADIEPLRPDQASPLATALRSLHEPAPPDAPRSAVRGMPLVQRRSVVEERLSASGLYGLWPIWRAALDSFPARERRWLHGDLHARNVLTVGGALTGLIDWGDMSAGDVATDLASAWLLFDSADARRALFERYGASSSEERRAAGWAVNFAALLLTSGEPRHVEMGEVVAGRLLARGDT